MIAQEKKTPAGAVAGVQSGNNEAVSSTPNYSINGAAAQLPGDAAGMTRTQLLDHYTGVLGWALLPVAGKIPIGKKWQENAITRGDQFPSGKSIGLFHPTSGTCALDLDHPLAAVALQAVGIDLEAILGAATYKIVGNPAKPPKPIYRIPDGLKLKMQQLAWPHETERQDNGKPKLITIFELRGNGSNCQDVLPPSVHPGTGKPYHWLDGRIPKNLEDIPILPANLLLLWQNWETLKVVMEAACPWQQQESAQRPAEQPTGNKSGVDVDAVQRAFNTQYTAADILTRNGYTAKGDKWLAPSSSSKIPGVTIFNDGKVFSHHGSDILNDGRPHDPYDLAVILEYDGDYKRAWRELGQKMGVLTETTKLHESAAAGATLEALLAQVDGLADRTAGLDLAKAAAHLDRGDWLKLRNKINERTKTTKGDLDAVYSEKRKIAEQAKKEAAAEAARAARAEQRGNNPFWPYDTHEGRIVYFGLYGRQTVADFTAGLTHEITSEAGEKRLRIEGEALRGGSFSLEISATDFNEPRLLAKALGAAAGGLDPVAAGMGKHLAPAISKLTEAAQLEKMTHFERVGWANGRFIVPGLLPENTTVTLAQKLPYDVSGGNLDSGIAALGNLLQAIDGRYSPIILAAILQAPLARLVGWDNERYAVMNTGRTGTLKTSFCQCAMCIYGRGFVYDANLIKLGEGATRNAVMAYATQASDLPLLVDNYKPNTAGGGSGFVGLLHNILEGGNKDRLTRNSVLMAAQPVYTFPIFTGEDVPDSDAATLARLLVVPFNRAGNDVNQQLQAAQLAAEHLPAVGRAWLTHLAENGAELRAWATGKFAMYRHFWVKLLNGRHSGGQNVLRIATNLTTNQLTFMMACQQPDFGPVLAAYTDSHKAGLEDIAGNMMQSTAAGLEAERFISGLAQALAGRRVVLLSVEDTRAKLIETELENMTVGQWVGDYTEGQRLTAENVVERLYEKMIGWQDDEGVYLLPELARAAVKRHAGDDLNGISSPMLYRQLKEVDYIYTSDRGTVLKRIDGQVRRVIHVKPGRL